MVIELPSDDETEQDKSVFDGRSDYYEAYWLYVDGVRYVGAVLDQSEATKEDVDHSPLARHFKHFYDKKEEYKEKCLDLPGNLPKYKDHFEEPNGDVRKIPLSKFEELGINWDEGDDPIWLPPEYEVPSVWEDDLEGMSESELLERIQSLRKENRKLREHRDELQEQMEAVRKWLTKHRSQEQRDSEGDGFSCPKCGEHFDSNAARNGHKAHCTESSPDGAVGAESADTDTSSFDLDELAEELPAVSEGQSVNSDKVVSEEEELENLNHLLSGSI